MPGTPITAPVASRGRTRRGSPPGQQVELWRKDAERAEGDVDVEAGKSVPVPEAQRHVSLRRRIIRLHFGRFMYT